MKHYLLNKIVTFTLLYLISIQVFGEISNIGKRKSFYLEIGGSGGVGSINFEKHFYKKNNFELTWRAGLSFAPIDKNNGTGIVFPIMLNGLIGRKSHHLELGVGQGITATTKGSFFTLATAAIGYRHQSESEKWFYRVTYTPLISYLVDFQIQQWGGISIGYTFNHKTK